MTRTTRLARLAKWLLISVAALVPILLYVGHSLDARLHYADDPRAQDWTNEGPYVFFEGKDSLSVWYLREGADGEYVGRESPLAVDSPGRLRSYYPIDSTNFEFEVVTAFETPPSVYDDGQPILALSDLEGNYGALRDFLIDAGVIDTNLNWTFGAGHLVLVGDLIDRGYFVTQILWFVYMLEQEARSHGGQVHYVVGNHELKMMYGDYAAADPKYERVAALLGRDPLDLYSSSSLLGNWLGSQNAIVKINDVLFVHGGLHPDLAGLDGDLEAINETLRRSYRVPVDAEPGADVDPLLSRRVGICWYRGYFRDDLSQEQVDRVLDAFGAQTIVVGHTLQNRVNRQFDGRVVAIDVMHPSDDHKLWPEGRSEGLLIRDGLYYRVREGGLLEAI